jgi:hypothetical protein
MFPVACSRDHFPFAFSASLKASNKPGRIALLCGVISRPALAAFIATHLGAELVERHGCVYRKPYLGLLSEESAKLAR